MKVYIVTRIPFPNGMAPGNRIKCYAKAILSQGIDVEIIIYTRTERYGIPPQNTIGAGVYEGISFRYVGGTPLRGRNMIVRHWHDFKDRRDCLGYLKSRLHDNDIVLGYCGQDVDYTFRLIELCHSHKAFFVRDLCEFPYGTGDETKKTVANRNKVLNKQTKVCDGYICISRALFDYISPYTHSKAKNIIIPIMVNYKEYELQDLSAEAEFPYIFHAGTLTEQKDGILGMIESFGLACKKLPTTVKFILTGNLEKAKAKVEIMNVIQKYGIQDRIIFTGYLSNEELKQYLSKASLVIINKYPTTQNRYCFSTKLGEYLAAGKPVIITNVGEAMNWLEDGRTAYIVETKDNVKLSEAIVDAFTNDNKRKEIAVAGQELCKRSFDYHQWGIVLKNYFFDLAKTNQSSK